VSEEVLTTEDTEDTKVKSWESRLTLRALSVLRGDILIIQTRLLVDPPASGVQDRSDRLLEIQLLRIGIQLGVDAVDLMPAVGEVVRRSGETDNLIERLHAALVVGA
jgi:hypothetical protein